MCDGTAQGDADLWFGKELAGKFLIQRKLGSGAMGTIYQAEQTSLGKTVAIKVLHSPLRGDAELLGRFKREAKAASRLNHPNCVQILDFGETEEGGLYIAMEYIQGINLATLLEREHPLDPLRVISIMKQVCLALDEAHAKGVLHRDLKPENIMVEERRQARDHVKVVDFGIAKLEDNEPNSRRSFQTLAGIVCGTPEYMSPEQARGRPLDARSDLYAIGVMMYHLLTDRLPFEAPSPIEVVTKHIGEIPVSPNKYRTNLPAVLNALILRLLEKERDARPASAMALHDELEAIERMLLREPALNPRASEAETTLDLRHSIELAHQRAQNIQQSGNHATQVMTTKAFDTEGNLLSPLPSDTVPDGAMSEFLDKDVFTQANEARVAANRDKAAQVSGLLQGSQEERAKDRKQVMNFIMIVLAIFAVCVAAVIVLI